MAKVGRKSLANERRAQILEAFHRCALRSGLERASLREVAQEAGLPGSILHHYFENRDEMISELVKKIVSGITEGHEAEVKQVKNPRGRFKKTIDYLFSPKAIQLEDGSLFYDFWSSAHRSERVRRTFQNQIRDQRKAFAGLLAETENFSCLSRTEMKEIANIIIALVEGAYYIMDMDGENVSPKRMARLTERFMELYAEDKKRTKAMNETASSVSRSSSR